MLTLAEAAKAVGLSRTALFKAIQAGRLSATKNDKGHFVVDPSELFRVYSPVNEVIKPVDEELTKLQMQLELTQKLLTNTENERDYLRRMLDEERRRLTNLLTHQPQPLEVKPVQSDPNDSPLYRKLFGR